jgi:hypothetical protein
MNWDNILLVVGKIAGIGGLAIGSLLLIFRTVLKTVPPPKKVLAPAYFKMIDKIILYTFILALVGVGCYVFLEYRKYAQLQQDHDALKQQLAQIQDVKLKARGAALEVLSCEVTFDFSNWSLVPEEERLTTRRSFELITSRRRIWRATPETQQFFATFGTDSPFEPVFDGALLSQEIPNTDQLQSGKDVLRRWILEYDIRSVPLFTPYDVVSEIKAWNCYQNDKMGHEGTLIMFPTRTATLKVIFPPDRRPIPETIRALDFPLDKSRSPKPVDSPKLTVAPDRSWVSWEIEAPHLNFHYILEWQWSSSSGGAYGDSIRRVGAGEVRHLRGESARPGDVH